MDTLWLVIIIIVVVFILLIFLSKFKFTIDDPSTRKERHSIRKNKNEFTNPNPQNFASHDEIKQGDKDFQYFKNIIYSRDQSELRNRIHILESQIRNIANNPRSQPEKIWKPTITGSPASHSQPPKREPQAFFMGTPSADGSFVHSNKTTTFQPKMTLYKFEIESNSSAYFSFFGDSDAVKYSLTNAYQYLSPVCNFSNEISPETKKIVTEKRGLAELQGENWIVKNKATIRYE